MEKVLCVLPSLARSFFSGMKLIEPNSGSDIGQSMSKTSLVKRSELPFGLVIFSKPTSAKPPVRINIKLLSRTDIQKMVERLEASLAGCKVNVPSWMAP